MGTIHAANIHRTETSENTHMGTINTGQRPLSTWEQFTQDRDL